MYIVSKSSSRKKYKKIFVCYNRVMHIRECECESNIVLSKFKFNCDEVDKTIPAPLPGNLNHFLLEKFSSKNSPIKILIHHPQSPYTERQQ